MFNVSNVTFNIMTEILFSDAARHYLVPGRTGNETFLFTVSSSEVNVIVRIAIPNQILESFLVLQTTQLGDNSVFIFKPIISEATNDPEIARAAVLTFIDGLVEKTSSIEKYIEDKKDSPEPVLGHLKNGLASAKEQITSQS